MANSRRSFRSKMLLLFGLSMLASGTITYVIYKLLQNYYRNNVHYGDSIALLRDIMRQVGDLTVFMILFVPLAVLFFYLFSKPYASYFERISEGIHRLANGDFSARVELNTNDEFQTVAEDINRAGVKLKNALERGDFAESSKDQLVLNLAHDLRTPLTSVLGYLDYLLKNEQLPAEQARHYTTIAYTKSRRLEKLIEELFEIAKMNYGKLPIDKKPIDLSELLHQLVEELYPILENNQLTARVIMPPRIMVEADGALLARVFENLLANAARYGKDGQFVDIKGELESDAVIVQVINYGHRIPPDELPFLFDMFYTGDQARTHQGGSTGLGLFIAKNIVEQHGGAIAADSTVTRTVFEVRIPLPAQYN
ncbi:HAMP domain-containing sensor histidine kinase [Cohnella lubricantis]|uniref:histidine kinase n=1 Tax=Cohnella lubricantis TaxID=2163172 RepID=A0A841TJ31_9BACL|nr:HAMP domain-containing sensor histidine kinase [Cohnella lubricantis]MBB6678937.1 HAMP domain-containing histidine kinase [Cohnella lubricantis]MBP2118845.1 signal transduction histidine kinase [Cohnella lubricantis]